ncbi:HPr family phosphocarrier protein [Helicovermis profundi]|uniref:Phosphocarrier protein HPr n=1 Tax=Helicovermis profundi TaxID=3065157 RepID=A0AAU9ETG9_9FIRM|nr:phosphocarrier protein HPr [Clostridia bacterium S502]
MQNFKIVVSNKTGLHARPASILAMEAQKYSSNICIEKDGKVVNAKSIMSILSVGASFEDELILKTNGEDEIIAMENIKELFKRSLANEK